TPAMTCAASAAGRVASDSFEIGSNFSSAILTSREIPITDKTPPIIVRGRLRDGSRSSSMKYNGLCQPPYVMTIACKAMINPLNDIEGTTPDAEYARVGTRRHMAT